MFLVCSGWCVLAIRVVQPTGELHALLANHLSVGGDEHVAVVDGVSREGRAVDGGGGLLLCAPVSVFARAFVFVFSW